MIYGLYLSATGVMANSYRQDVIANNLANSETVGFKKDLASFQQRRTEAQERGTPTDSDRLLENLGGGLLAAPTTVDWSQGDIEQTANPLDAALEGPGYFAIKDANGATRFTRDGRFLVDRSGFLVLANGQGQQVLDNKGKPIQLDPNLAATQTTIGRFGEITQDRTLVATLGVYDVPDTGQLKKLGGNLLSYPDEAAARPIASTPVRSEFIERSNVEPASELAQLMDAQRQLEANANMIRYQDQTLARLVNDVGKIS
jgi:flagellar basal body rod protein FlgG